MARRSAAIVAPTERLIVKTLRSILPAAAASYEQCLLDLGGGPRRSYRGIAHELREVVRETLDYLAPDGEVMAAPGFKLEAGLSGPTQRQKAKFVLHKRNLSREAMAAPELSLAMIEELGASITRTAYARGSKSAHTLTSVSEVRQLKMYIDAVIGELLEIHAQ